MIPVVFDGCFGWLHPAAGNRGVVLCAPHGYEELCVHRQWAALAERLAALVQIPAASGWLTRIVVRKASGAVFVPIEDVDWIEAADYCARIHARGKVHVIRETMQRLEGKLDPAKFFRVHRSGIVNLDRVREMQPTPQGDHVLVLTDGSRVRLSRARKAALEERLGQPL